MQVCLKKNRISLIAIILRTSSNPFIIVSHTFGISNFILLSHFWGRYRYWRSWLWLAIIWSNWKTWKFCQVIWSNWNRLKWWLFNKRLSRIESFTVSMFFFFSEWKCSIVLSRLLEFYKWNFRQRSTWFESWSRYVDVAQILLKPLVHVVQ